MSAMMASTSKASLLHATTSVYKTTASGGKQMAPCTSPFKSGAHPHNVLSSKTSSFTSSPISITSSSSKVSSTRAAHTPVITAAAAASGIKGSVAVAGATGLIGSKLVQDLVAQGYTVKVLTRNPAKARTKLNYPGVEFVAPSNWATAICGTAAVVNLAGEPIATRWTDDLKREIKRSRVEVTNKVVNAINACPEDQRPSVLVNASAVGYYGASDNQTFNEASSSGSDYLAEVCRDWEAAAVKANTRVVVLRNGIVLAKVQEGGALSKMIPVFQIFAGGPLGSGKQWCSWIHRDDAVGLILEGITNTAWKGIYNATAPNPVRMGELCSALGSAMGRPSYFPVPDFALRTLLGEGAQVVLEGQRVLPARAQDQGYRFKYAKVEDALRHLVK